jgi:PEP-CTERM/exosortase A-associated glycosyltransferase
MRVLHVLHHSTPYLDGYGVRSKSIVDFQRRLGIEPLVVTSAHHELEVKRRAADCPASEIIEGTVYHRTPQPSGRAAGLHMRTPFLRERALVSAIGTTLERVLRTQQVDIVHSHSPVLCGQPALAAARRHGIPMVYEIRAFWEDAFLLGARPFSIANAKYRYSRALETRLVKDVDAVIAISRRMIDDLAERGVHRDKLHLVPNGVDLKAFSPVERDGELAESLGLPPAATLGFIGTFHEIEGLDCLVRAMPAILASEPRAKLLLVGTGPDVDRIAGLVAELGLQSNVLLTGRVKHSDVRRYYSVIDVLVYPRHSFRVTELVTPLKPLEAMALGKAVVGSDVGGIAELLNDGRAGMIFEAGNSASLARAVVQLLSDSNARQRLAEDGRGYVMRERGWDQIAQRYVPIYDRLLAHRAEGVA